VGGLQGHERAGQEKKWNARAYMKGRRKDQKQGHTSKFLHSRKTEVAVAYVTGAGWRDGEMDRVGMKGEEGERAGIRLCASTVDFFGPFGCRLVTQNTTLHLNDMSGPRCFH
jgi:hypothetical protein